MKISKAEKQEAVKVLNTAINKIKQQIMLIPSVDSIKKNLDATIENIKDNFDSSLQTKQLMQQEIMQAMKFLYVYENYYTWTDQIRQYERREYFKIENLKEDLNKKSFSLSIFRGQTPEYILNAYNESQKYINFEFPQDIQEHIKMINSPATVQYENINALLQNFVNNPSLLSSVQKMALSSLISLKSGMIENVISETNQRINEYNHSCDIENLQNKIISNARSIQRNQIGREWAHKELSKLTMKDLREARKGFQVGKLEMAGFENLEQIYCSTYEELLNVMGEKSSEKLKKYVDDVYENLLNQAPVQLSIDAKDSKYQDLILLIYDYYLRNIYAQTVDKKIIKSTQDAIKQVENLNNYKLLFSTKEIEKVMSLCSWLWYNSIPKYTKPTKQQAIEHFAQQPILYTGVLKKLCPETMEKDSQRKQFSKALLKRIDGMELNLVGFNCELRSYQFFAAKYIISEKRVLIGDEMGLGKTIEALAAIVHLWNKKEKYFVVFCPLTVAENWRREIEKFTKIPARIYGSRYNEIIQYKKEGGVLIVPYGRDPYEKIKDLKLTMVVADEAHFIKNPHTKRTSIVARTLTLSKYKVFMTGTPLENKVSEMINLIGLLDRNIADQLEDKLDTLVSSEFKKIISNVYFRRTTEQVALELPELIENDEWVSLKEDERYSYEVAILTKKWMLARQMSFDTSGTKTSAKIERIVEIVKNAIDEKRKVIIFSYFLNTLSVLKRMFGKYAIGPINGEVRPAERQKMVDQFTNSNIPILLTQIVTGGTGLNIQAASVAIICEPQYKPSTEQQAVARAHRMGQARNVLAFHIYSENTIEERIKGILDKKKQIFKEYADESIAGMESIEIDKKLMAELEQKEYEDIINNKENAEKAKLELERLKKEDNKAQELNPTEESKKAERKKMTDKLRWTILFRDDFTCQACGASRRQDKNVQLEVDHIIPVSKGGRTVPDNLQTLCHKCNMGKMTDIYDAKN